jgi:hypothetical protein
MEVQPEIVAISIHHWLALSSIAAITKVSMGHRGYV